MESFWGSMQTELLNRKKWMTYVELATAMADYIVNFCYVSGLSGWRGKTSSFATFTSSH